MLRLVSLSEGGEPFRTPLPASVVAALDPVRRRLLDLLVRGRLVTSRDGGYDIAHEALVRAWPRLRTWLDEDRAGQQIRRHLSDGRGGMGRPRPGRHGALPRCSPRSDARLAGTRSRAARRHRARLHRGLARGRPTSWYDAWPTRPAASDGRTAGCEPSWSLRRCCSSSPPSRGWWLATRDSPPSAARTPRGPPPRRPSTSRSCDVRWTCARPTVPWRRCSP